MSIEKWRNLGKYFLFHKNKIFYGTKGKGSILLLLHGFPTSSFDWHLIINELAENYTVVYFDMIGYGYSDKPLDFNYSIFSQADIAEALLKYLEITSCHILAHDKGDTVANELLARHLDQNLNVSIETCCFLNGGLFPGVHKPRTIQWLLMTPLGKYLSKFYTKGMLTSTFSKIFGPNTLPTAQEMQNYWDLMEYNNGRSVFHLLIRYMQDRMDHESRWLKALQQTKIPLRLIDGAFDPISGEHMAIHYKKVIPEPDVVLLKNIGHYPQIEAPDQVLLHYFAFRKLNDK